MSRLTDEQIEELERMEDEATPGPWERWVGHGTIVAGPATKNTRRAIGGHRATVCEVEDEDGWGDEETEANGDADADLIPAARNALRSLLAEVRASRSKQSLAPWYEADGSVTMLPAEEVVRRRRVAAVVLGMAQVVMDGIDRNGGVAVVSDANLLRGALAELRFDPTRPPSSSVGGDSRGTGAVPSDGEESGR